MNVEIGAEAAQFPEKEYINGIAVAVHVCGRIHMRKGDREVMRELMKVREKSWFFLPVGDILN
jgi:hypothetical protein